MPANIKVDTLNSRTLLTRNRIIAAAELLFAREGINGPSLQDINLAAGQRNKNATHYHFGDRNGLLQAIIDKHMPGLIISRHRHMDQAEANGNADVRHIARAILSPLLEKFRGTPNDQAYILITAELLSSRAIVFEEQQALNIYIHEHVRLTGALEKALSSMPASLVRQRLLLACTTMLHGLAYWVREIQRGRQTLTGPATQLFIDNLEDCLCNLLCGPVSFNLKSVENRDLYRL
jgi:AcrR family transcriptional regulator